jgi:hypothetical protein
MYHLQGACRFGTQCSFAHALTEMNNTPDLRKTQLCKDFVKGCCDNPNCDFAHTDTELRSTDVFFKKTLCIWNEKGKCRNGAQCRFAHGVKELCSEPTMRPSIADMGLVNLGAEALSEQGQDAKGKKTTSSHKGKKSGSNCSSISYQSTTSGSSGRPSGSGEGSGTPSGSSFSGTPMSRTTSMQSEPMKVEFTDYSPHNASKSMTAKKPPQPRFANNPAQPQLAEALEVLQNELRGGTASPLATYVAEAIANPKALTGGNEDSLQSQMRGNEDSLQMELEGLRKSVFLLTSHCNQLQERVNVGDNPGPMGNLANMHAQGFIRSREPQVLTPPAYNGLDYSTSGRNLQSAYLAEAFAAQMQASNAEESYWSVLNSFSA